jgi:cbb3-type cytochrome oxidase maturation protein
MSVVYIVLPLALLIAVLALYVFIRVVRAGQMDDMDTPSLRVLHDDTPRTSDSKDPSDR